MLHHDYIERLRPIPPRHEGIVAFSKPEPTQDFLYDLDFKAPHRDGAKALRYW